MTMYILPRNNYFSRVIGLSFMVLILKIVMYQTYICQIVHGILITFAHLSLNAFTGVELDKSVVTQG